jgi:beta-lactamase regulating signal transducer with metallopeptidase domain
MMIIDRIAFNVLLNTALSFLGGLLIVFLCIHLFRVKSSILKLYLYSLPFLKVIVDIIRGIPPESYVWSDLNFYSLPEDMGGRLKAMIGASEFGPMLALTLSIGPKEDMHTSLYSLSLPDVTYTWLIQNIGKAPLTTLIAAVMIASTFLVLRRISMWAKFEVERRNDRKHYGQWLKTETVGRRNVDVYISPTYSGSPFTGGILKPYICFPDRTFSKLSTRERRSVIGHELMHVRHFDILQTVIIKILGDLFWFIPLYRILSRKVEELRELVADRRSVLAEEDAGSLAKGPTQTK